MKYDKVEAGDPLRRPLMEQPTQGTTLVFSLAVPGSSFCRRGHHIMVQYNQVQLSFLRDELYFLHVLHASKSF